MTDTAQSPAGGTKRTTPRWRRVAPLVAALVAVAVLVAACSGGGASATPNGISSPSGTSAQSSGEQSGTLYASCMRTQGVPNFPDSAVSVIDGQAELHIPRGIKTEPDFLSATQACQRDLPGRRPPAKHVNLPAELNFSRCMRSHGITDFPDPLPGGGWAIPGDTNSPQFAAAARACQSTGIH